MIRLIALDFDGTVAGRGQKFDATMENYIRRWLQQGIGTVICSGRPYRSLKRELEPLQLNIPIISNNGNLIRYKDSEETVYKHVFPRALAKTVIEEMEKVNIHPILHVDRYDDGYDLVTLHDMTERESIYVQMYENLYRRMEPEEAAKEDILAIAGFTTPADYYRLIEVDAIKNSGLISHLLKSYDPKLSLFECIGISTNKWRGLSSYAIYSGLTPQNILAVGDDTNDIAMIEGAAIGIAMDSAPDAVKEAANMVCDIPPEEYGVFRKVDEVLRNRSLL